MNIYYVLARKDFFELGSNGRVTHASGIVRGLADNDVEVNVLSSSSAQKYCGEKCSYHYVKGQGIFWYISLILNLIQLRNKSDFTIVRYSTSLGWLLCIIMNIFHRNKWGFEVNGLGYHQLTGSSSKIKSTLYYLERFFIAKSPYVNCVSDKLKSELCEVNENIVTIPNAGNSDISLFEKINFSSSNNKINLVYMGMYHNYYDLVGIAKDLSNIENIQLHFYGSGNQEDSLKKISIKANNITVHGRYDLCDLVDRGSLDGKTILLLPYKEGTVADYGSPTKLFEYLSLGLPLLLTKVGQPYELLSGLNNNCFNFYDESNLKDKVQTLIDNDINFDRGDIISYYLENHTWKCRCEEYLNTIRVHIDYDFK